MASSLFARYTAVMAFTGDLKELREQWNELPPIVRSIAVVMLALQILSIGSIADSVFKFKGFIKEGIEFYRAVTDPILEYIPDFLHLDRLGMDGIILFMLFMVSSLRASFREYPSPPGSILQITIRKNTFSDLINGLLVLLLSFISMVMVSSVESLTPMLFLLFLLLHSFYKGYIRKDVLSSDSRKTLVLFFIPVITVFILAAVSEGLTRI